MTEQNKPGSETNPEAQVHGLPVMNIDSMMGTSISNDFEFESLTGDLIMCEVIDQNSQNEVYRGGIWISTDITKTLWRRGQVVLTGPNVPKEISIGCQICYPGDRGIPMIAANKKKYIFLNYERVFGVLKPIVIPLT